MLSQTCKYVLRAGSAIARHHEQGPLRGKDIAEQMNIPLNYLHKILRELVREGILKSTRGGRGGFVLARPPVEIALIDVLRPFDENLRATVCPFENPQCGIANPCPLHARWSLVVQGYTEFLRETTLADLTTNWKAVRD